MQESNTIDDYIATLPANVRPEFERIRNVVAETVPAATQGRSYGMPAFMYKGKPLISFMARKSFLSIYPFSGKVVDRLCGKLAGYDLSSGTIRFSLDNPIPEPLLREIVMCRLLEIDTRP